MRSIFVLSIILIVSPLLAVEEYSVHSKTDNYLTVVCNYEHNAKDLYKAIYQGFIFAQDKIKTDKINGYVYVCIAIENTNVIMIFRMLYTDVNKINTGLDAKEIKALCDSVECIIVQKEKAVEI